MTAETIDLRAVLELAAAAPRLADRRLKKAERKGRKAAGRGDAYPVVLFYHWLRTTRGLRGPAPAPLQAAPPPAGPVRVRAFFSGGWREAELYDAVGPVLKLRLPPAGARQTARLFDGGPGVIHPEDRAAAEAAAERFRAAGGAEAGPDEVEFFRRMKG